MSHLVSLLGEPKTVGYIGNKVVSFQRVTVGVFLSFVLMLFAFS